MTVSTTTRSNMKRAQAPPSWQVAMTVLVAGIPAFVLGRVIWPDTPGYPTPPESVMPIFILTSALESLLFGVGVAFVVFAPRWLAGDRSKLATASYVAIAWSLLRWWPHDNFHRVSHDYYSLAGIEVVFHVTLIVSIVIIAADFVRALRERAAK